MRLRIMITLCRSLRRINWWNSQSRYNKGGRIKAIPIIMYHSIGDSKKDAVTDVDLFKNEMEYLHDNKFKVITISDLEYDEKHNYLYMKDFKSVAEAPTTNVTSNVTTPTIAPEGNPILEILKKLFGLK